MRASLLALPALLLLACPAGNGTQGPPGADGPPGATGPTGPTGAQGSAGPSGAQGATGSQGAAGPQGPTGPQGVQGPPGAVLVLDGGVVSGPPGPGVVLSAIAPGATCPTGGVRVTQLSDGGIVSLCNGAAGATGPQGPAGISLTATALAVSSAQCPTGGVLVGLPDGGALAVCNGATGAAGPTGATGPAGSTGATGAAGPAGPMGPPGPPGPALFLDGGLAFPNTTPSFAGFTTATYTGSIGGDLGANAKCNAQYPGSVFCTVSDFDRSNPVTPPPAAGAWIDSDRAASGQRTQNSCSSGGGSWNLGTVADTGTNLNALGVFTSQLSCDGLKPLACCRVQSAVVFRGYTSATFTGSLGGTIGANAKCAAELPGSSFCTVSDFDLANPMTPPPASGAWIDSNRSATGTRTQNSCSAGGGSWNLGTTGDTGTNLNALGVFVSQVACNQVKPLACCQAR